MRAFFYEWFVDQRNASVHTVRSHRDTWRLFLRFIAQRAEKKFATIILADLAASEVAALRHIEHVARLHDRLAELSVLPRCAAYSTLWHRDLHLCGDQGPCIAAQCVEILQIPIGTLSSDPAEVTAILAQPSRSILEGLPERCSRSSTAAEHELRKRLICAPRRSGSIA
ncbi:hypothetical protein [Mesorhizobium sp. f-mel]